MSPVPAGALPPEPTELDWMELHLRCLHQHDARGRIVRTRQPSEWPSPLFHLGRTRLGNLWRFRDDLDPHAIRELARLAGREPALAPGHPPPERLEAIRSVLGSVAEGVLDSDNLAVPYGNLASMYKDAGQDEEARDYAALAAKSAAEEKRR